jgi:hypothetical protein
MYINIPAIGFQRSTVQTRVAGRGIHQSRRIGSEGNSAAQVRKKKELFSNLN